MADNRTIPDPRAAGGRTKQPGTASETEKREAFTIPGADATLPETGEGTGAPAAAPSAAFAKGSVLMGAYRIESDPIHGGMGSVWRVRHTGWNTDLAMKRPQPRMFATEDARQRFTGECQCWINLGLHPNIVSCYYVREIGGVPAIFSEWMENGSLKNRIDDGSLYKGTVEEVLARLLDIAIQYARGLHYAHGQGLIHQDVKPDNLLLTNDWQAKAADFGLANARAQLTVTEGDPALRDPGQTLNADSGGYTPAYCSMEQMDGRMLTRRTDIYSWAVSVMEAYIGARPWTNGVVAGAGCREYMAESRIPVPEALRDLLAKCMETEAERRPHDFAEIEGELKKIYRAVTGRPYPRREPKAAPDTPGSLNNRALSWLDLGQTERARDIWQKLRDSGYAEAIYNDLLLEVQTDLIGLNDAVRLMEETARNNPGEEAALLAEKMRRFSEKPAPVFVPVRTVFPDLDKAEAFCTDEAGRTALAGGVSDSRLFDLSTGAELLRFKPFHFLEAKSVRHVQLDETGTYALITYGKDRTTGKAEVYHLREPNPNLVSDWGQLPFFRPEMYYDAAFAGDRLYGIRIRERYGEALLTACDLTAALADINTPVHELERELYSVPLPRLFDIQFSNDGRRFVIAGGERILLYDTAGGECVGTQKFHDRNCLFTHGGCTLDHDCRYLIDPNGNLYDLDRKHMARTGLLQGSGIRQILRVAPWKGGAEPEFLVWGKTESGTAAAETFTIRPKPGGAEYAVSRIRSTVETLDAQEACARETEAIRKLLERNRVSEALEKWREAKDIPGFTETKEYPWLTDRFDRDCIRASVEKCVITEQFPLGAGERIILACGGMLLTACEKRKGGVGSLPSTVISLRDAGDGRKAWELDLSSFAGRLYDLIPEDADYAEEAGIIAVKAGLMTADKTCLFLIDFRSGKCLAEKKVPDRYGSVLITPDGRKIWLTDSGKSGRMFRGPKPGWPHSLNPDDPDFISLYRARYAPAACGAEDMVWLSRYRSDGLQFTRDGWFALARTDSVYVLDIRNRRAVAGRQGLAGQVLDRSGRKYYAVAVNDGWKVVCCHIEYDYRSPRDAG